MFLAAKTEEKEKKLGYKGKSKNKLYLFYFSYLRYACVCVCVCVCVCCTPRMYTTHHTNHKYFNILSWYSCMHTVCIFVTCPPPPSPSLFSFYSQDVHQAYPY